MDPIAALNNQMEIFPEDIRARPGMYVGGTEAFGFTIYLVCVIARLLAQEATYIAVHFGDGIEITSDAKIKIERTEWGLCPFGVVLWQADKYKMSWIYGSPFEEDNSLLVLNALSRELHVSLQTAQQSEELSFTRGELNSHHITEARNEAAEITLRFHPDTDIFTVTELSPTIFESWFRRLSFLHAGVRFSLSVNGKKQVFQADNGIVDLFTVLSSPYQLMHEPIHFVREEGNCKIHLAMAYQSWTDNQLWCFINNGRAVEGGTHEDGLKHALKSLRKKLASPEQLDNGVVAVISVQYSNGLVYQGASRNRVINTELKMMVSRLVVEGTVEWLHDHPDVAAQISRLNRSMFPEWM